MKIVKPIWLMVFSIVMLAACNNKEKENEEIKPVEVAPEEIIEANPDQIRKVIRYNNAGAVQDSVFFRYDNKNRLAKIEYGAYVNGQYKNKVNYSYAKDQNGNNIILEENYELETTGQYNLVFSVSYTMGANYNRAGFIKMSSPRNISGSYEVYYDSIGFIKNVTQRGVKKNQDYYLDLDYIKQNNNIAEIMPDSYPDLGDHTTYEYYSEPYNHDLFTSIYETGNYNFWNSGLVNLFDIRYSLLGNRNQNLLKKMRVSNSGFPPSFTDTSFEYEFNSLGLVSKVNTSTTSATGVTTPMTTKYEIFY